MCMYRSIYFQEPRRRVVCQSKVEIHVGFTAVTTRWSDEADLEGLLLVPLPPIIRSSTYDGRTGFLFLEGCERGATGWVHGVVLVVVELVVRGVDVTECRLHDTVVDERSPLDNRTGRGLAIAVPVAAEAGEAVAVATTIAGTIASTIAGTIAATICRESGSVRGNSRSNCADCSDGSDAVAKTITGPVAETETIARTVTETSGVAKAEATAVTIAGDSVAHDGGSSRGGDGDCRCVCHSDCRSSSYGHGWSSGYGHSWSSGHRVGRCGVGSVRSKGTVGGSTVSSTSVGCGTVSPEGPGGNHMTSTDAVTMSAGRVDGHDVSRLWIVDSGVVVTRHDVRVVPDERGMVRGAVRVGNGVRESLGGRVQATGVDGAPERQHVEDQKLHSVESSHVW